MKSITLRQFQLKPTDYLGDLPLTLTRYGKPIAILSNVTTLETKPIKPQEEKKTLVSCKFCSLHLPCSLHSIKKAPLDKSKSILFE